jgi:hypothetical protein
MVALITLDRNMTARQRAGAAEARPRAAGRLAGGYLADMAALRKAIALCVNCRPKFNAAAHGYATPGNIPFVQDRCDGCKTYSTRAHFLVHQPSSPV